MFLKSTKTYFTSIAMFSALLSAGDVVADDSKLKMMNFNQTQYNYAGDTIKTVVTTDSVNINSEKGDFLSMKLEGKSKLTGQYKVLRIQTKNDEFRYYLGNYKNNLSKLMDKIEGDLLSRDTGVLLHQFEFRSKDPDVFPDVSPEEGAACLAGAVVAGIASGGWGAAAFGAICLAVLDDNSIETD